MRCWELIIKHENFEEFQISDVDINQIKYDYMLFDHLDGYKGYNRLTVVEDNNSSKLLFTKAYFTSGITVFKVVNSLLREFDNLDKHDTPITFYNKDVLKIKCSKFIENLRLKYPEYTI